MRQILPIVDAEIGGYFGGNDGARIGFDTDRCLGSAIDPAMVQPEKAMRTARFEVYQAKDGWRWRLRAKNGRIIATGEAHTRKADANRAIETVKTTIMSLQGGRVINIIQGVPKMTPEQQKKFIQGAMSRPVGVRSL